MPNFVSMKLSDFAEIAIPSLQAKETTRKAYRAHLRTLSPNVLDCDIARLTPLVLDAELARFTRLGLSKTTARNRLKTVQRLVRKAKANEHEIVEGVLAWTCGKSEAKSRDLDPDTIPALWARARSKKEPAVLSLLLAYHFGGCRAGDLVALSWAHMDADRIRFTSQKTGVDLSFKIRAEVAWILHALGSRKRFFLTPYMDLSTERKPTPQDRIRAASYWRKDLKRIGVDVRPHDMRRCAAIKLTESGVDAQKVSRICGWRGTSQVEAYTRHRTWTDLDEIADLL